MIYPIIISKFNDTYYVESPGFPEENFIDSPDLDEVLENAEITIKEFIVNCLENDEGYPSPFTYEQLVDVCTNNSDKIVNLISVDIIKCIEQYGRRYVKKSVTIPSILNQYGITHELNFSAILANGIYDVMYNNNK